MRGVYYGGERPERVGGQPHPPAFSERNQPMRQVYESCVIDKDGHCTRWSHDHSDENDTDAAGTNP